MNRSYTKTRPVWAQTLSQRCFLGGTGQRVVIGGRLRFKLVGAREFAVALAVAVDTGAGADEPAKIIVSRAVEASTLSRTLEVSL